MLNLGEMNVQAVVLWVLSTKLHLIQTILIYTEPGRDDRARCDSLGSLVYLGHRYLFPRLLLP